MARPLFEIAREIAADWPTPTPQAKSYLNGMYSLLGMDDRVADLDASTAVRMFLLYSKPWTGPNADRVKAELQVMRKAEAPTNSDLLSLGSYQRQPLTITHCEVCDAALGERAKFIEGYTHWNACVRMCMKCNYFVSTGLSDGNGALYLTMADGSCVKLHGEPRMPAARPVREEIESHSAAPQMSVKFQLKFLGRKVLRKCANLARRLVKRSA